MKTFQSLICCLLFIAPSYAEEKKWPLALEADDKWKVTHEDGLISLTRPENKELIFFFQKWPAPGRTDQIPELVNKMAKGLLDEAAMNDEISLSKPSYAIEDLDGDQFSGKVAIFELKDGSNAMIFMISDGHSIWNGQYHGPKKMWAEAKSILESLKK